MHFLWITDPWDTLHHQTDTTLRLIEEAAVAGHTNSWCARHSIRWQSGGVVVDARRVHLRDLRRTTDSFDRAPAQSMDLSCFESIQYRVDPPVDLAYLHSLQLLHIGCLHRVGGDQKGISSSPKIVNRPEHLFSLSEKLIGAFIELLPPSVVACNWETLSSFGLTEGQTVLKPLHRAMGQGVVLLDWRNSTGIATSRDHLATATFGFEQPVVLQRYLSGVIEHGETRLWFLDGDLLGHVLKLPTRGDFRIDVDQGDCVVAAGLSQRSEEIAKRVGTWLQKQGIRLAAVDLIDEFITDFNFTSPGLLTQMECVLGRNLAKPIIEALTSP